MHTTRFVGPGLLILWTVCGATAQETVWRSSNTAPAAHTAPAAAPAAVSLRRPVPIEPPAGCDVELTSYSDAGDVPGMQSLVRSQAPGVAVPPVPPPSSPPPPPPPPSAAISENELNCGVATTPPPTNIFLDGPRGFFEGICGAVGHCFTTCDGRKPFQSDQCFKDFISPVTDPFYFEDPRALTEIRPIFMWQEAPSGGPASSNLHGANIQFGGVQARVAVTERLSFVVQELGWLWTEVPSSVSSISSGNGFAQVDVGGKYTFIRNETNGTLLAGGLTFEIPTGSAQVYQNNNVGIRPYASFGQKFLCTPFGSFHFLDTLGYDFGVNNSRSEFVFNNAHVDFNVGDLNKIFPLIELNWFNYTVNGTKAPINFEGQDLFNFGAQGVAGKNALSIAFGARYKISEALQFGAAYQLPLITPYETLGWRVTVDMIIRY